MNFTRDENRIIGRLYAAGRCVDLPDEPALVGLMMKGAVLKNSHGYCLMPKGLEYRLLCVMRETGYSRLIDLARTLERDSAQIHRLLQKLVARNIVVSVRKRYFLNA